MAGSRPAKRIFGFGKPLTTMACVASAGREYTGADIAKTAAIKAGLPIVANNLGAFTERLVGRPMTWLTDYHASTEELLAVFDAVRIALRDRSRKTPVVQRQGPGLTKKFAMCIHTAKK